MSDQAQDSEDELAHDSGIPADIDLAQFTRGLIGDLNGLRADRVSIPKARAIAELARQIIRSMHVVVQAQRVIEDKARTVNPKDRDDG